jgi:hypothetical protein
VRAHQNFHVFELDLIDVLEFGARQIQSDNAYLDQVAVLTVRLPALLRMQDLS